MEEIWRDIKGFEGIYQISNFGNVKSYDKRVKNGNGYAIKKGKDIVVKVYMNNQVDLCGNTNKVVYLFRLPFFVFG